MALTDDDPGRPWRRTMRCGILIAILLFSIEWAAEGLSPWEVFSRMSTVASGGSGRFRPLYSDSPIAIWLFRAFCCTFLTVFFSTPIFAIICSPRILRPGPARLPYFAGAMLLWFVALIPPYFFGVVQLGSIQSQDTTALALGLLSALLLLGAITLLNAWRYRDGPRFVFWLGIYPIATAVVSLACFLASILIVLGFQYGYFLIPLSGFCAAALLLIAWLKWWSAVSEYERENRARP